VVWLVNHGADLEGSRAVPSGQRTVYIELDRPGVDKLAMYGLARPLPHCPTFELDGARCPRTVVPAPLAWSPFGRRYDRDFRAQTPSSSRLEAAPALRHVKWHHPAWLLPAAVPKAGRVVYVYRNPKDTVVSWFHFQRLNPLCVASCPPVRPLARPGSPLAWLVRAREREVGASERARERESENARTRERKNARKRERDGEKDTYTHAHTWRE